MPSTSKGKYLKYNILYFPLFILFILNNSCTKDDTSLSLFLGPQKGYKTTLENLDEGITIEIVGVSNEQNYINIKHYLIASDKTPWPPGESKIIESSYTLKVRGNELLQISNLGETILLKKPLFPNLSKWEIIGESSKEGKITFNCIITERGNKIIADKERLFITTECCYEDSEWDGLDIWRFTYAEGIGQVGISSIFKDQNGNISNSDSLSFVSYEKAE